MRPQREQRTVGRGLSPLVAPSEPAGQAVCRRGGAPRVGVPHHLRLALLKEEEEMIITAYELLLHPQSDLIWQD